MKKLLLALAFFAASVTLYANPICYFTFSQARRTLNFLSEQNELVIFCGHQYELETYVIVSDVWIERVNSRYYEIWLYGIDAYTGEDLFMPIDLSCIWLLDRWSNTMYNAARYLHFYCDAPYTTLIWAMPSYHSFTRVAHPTHYSRTYHYDVHRHGWRPTPGAGLPPYYMRTPTAPMPIIASPYVPGRERPTVQINNSATQRPAPTTTRTASTPVRTTTPEPAGNNRQPSASSGSNRPASGNSSTQGGTHDTRTSGTTTRSSSTPAQPATQPATPSRPASTTPTTNRNNNTPAANTSNRNNSTSTRAASTTQRTASSSSSNSSNRTGSTSKQTSNTKSNNSRPTSTTNRTGSSNRR